MKKFYFLILFFAISAVVFSQDQDSTSLKTKQKSTVEIEGFKMYPNPITNGILHIRTLENGVKSIQIFDILGKRVLSRDIINPQINLSNLKSGVYILKVTENNRTATRKLVIK